VEYWIGGVMDFQCLEHFETGSQDRQDQITILGKEVLSAPQGTPYAQPVFRQTRRGTQTTLGINKGKDK
jgi:hypothetical protein